VFERFTDRARRVVVLAQEEARLLNHNYIGTEHILLGLIHEGEGVAAKALEELGISLKIAKGLVVERIGEGQTGPTGHVPFTPRAKKVLELSFREALMLGHDHIGEEHILLGLVREGDGVASQVLRQLGADLRRVRAEVIRRLDSFTVVPEGSSTTLPKFESHMSDVPPHGSRRVRIEQLARKEAEALGESSVRADHRWVASLRLEIEEATDGLRNLQSVLDQALEDLQRRRRLEGKSEDQPDEQAP
jgi:ATP-dependent Clp protease ATP-binding subunit ClpA